MDEIWYGRHAIGANVKAYFTNSYMADKETSEVRPTLAPVALGPNNDAWL